MLIFASYLQKQILAEGTKVPSFYTMIDKKKVIALIEERMNELDKGLFIVDVNISATNVIHVEIDKHIGGVSIEECMSVSRNIEHNLDREKEDFELNVSSAGLDKPFRVPAQYTKNIGRTVKVKLNDGTKKEGELAAANEEAITLRTSRVEKIEGQKKKVKIEEDEVLPLTTIKETKIVISFK